MSAGIVPNEKRWPCAVPASACRRMRKRGRASGLGRRRLLNGLSAASSNRAAPFLRTAAPCSARSSTSRASPPSNRCRMSCERSKRLVALFFGLLRPYNGLEVLLEAWRGVHGAELWIVGRPRIPLEPVRALAPPGVRFVPRFVSDAELPANFRRADVVVLPYSRTERLDFSVVLAIALAFGKPVVLTDIGGLAEVADTGAVRLVAPDDADALRAAQWPDRGRRCARAARCGRPRRSRRAALVGRGGPADAGGVRGAWRLAGGRG
jgi:glycosyltransferase involved in cell wall biosynthesis